MNDIDDPPCMNCQNYGRQPHRCEAEGFCSCDNRRLHENSRLVAPVSGNRNIAMDDVMPTLPDDLREALARAVCALGPFGFDFDNISEELRDYYYEKAEDVVWPLLENAVESYSARRY